MADVWLSDWTSDAIAAALGTQRIPSRIVADREYARWFERAAPLTDTEAIGRRHADELNAMIAARRGQWRRR